jgi:protein TonB
MSNPVIFKSLPATFPDEDKYRRPSAISSIVIHITLVTTLVVVPLFIPQRIEQWRMLTLIAPAPPPLPPSLPAPAETEPKPAPDIQPVIQVDPGTIITPTEIPKEIARIVDDVPVGAIGGVTGGSSSSSVGGVLRAVLLTTTAAPEAPLPPPPPPPPPPVTTFVAPVRVGGNIQEPKVIRLVPAIYPKLAIKARVKGTVILEATVTTDGAVDEIKVISGNPLLIQAAIDCVKQWRYEPTFLNGEPVPVILTAKVNFQLEPQS